MKSFLIKIGLFIVILAGIDVASGFLFRYLETNTRGGMTLRDRYISRELNKDIIIYGSSRCVHHYNPSIFEDSLGLSCYNAGQDGNGIILSYGRLLMQNHRMVPKMIICDINPEFDLLAGDNHRYLQWLKTYYDEDGIKNIFDAVDKMEQYKMMSMLYRYNSRFLEIATDFIHPLYNPEPNGFVPQSDGMDKRKIKQKDKKESFEFDPVKIYHLERFIDEGAESRLVFVISPIWYGMDEDVLQPLREICHRKGIILLEFENSDKYVHNDYYFHDGNHMSKRGADEFSKEVVEYLKKMYDDVL